MPRTADELRHDFGLLTEEELSIMLDNRIDTIRSWRAEKFGPKWVKLGRSVYYRDQDVNEWITENVIYEEAAP